MSAAAVAPTLLEITTKRYEITADRVVRIEAEDKQFGTTHINYGGYSSAGLKSENQDAFAVLQPETSVRRHKGTVAVIADGVSCSARSQEASQLSVNDFISDYYSTPDTWPVKDAAARVLNALNSWLYQHGNQGPSHSSELVTTFSSVIIKARTAHIFHAGDSRIYCLRQGNLEQLTRDHSLSEANGNRVLTNALGMGTHLEIDYLQREIEAGDIFLMTTDGIHDFLNNQTLKEFLHRDSSSLESVSQLIANTALSKGSDDNLSCLLLQVASLPKEAPAETSRALQSYTIPPVMEVGMSIDGFQILEKLHSDLCSHLYLVKSTEDDTYKTLRAPCANYAKKQNYIEALIREQWIAQRLNHPRITHIYPRPPDTHFIYNLYEYTPFQTLRQWMHDNSKPSLSTVRETIEQIASGLRAFQRQGMMHRDLRPENILIDSNGHIKLIDFGTIQISGLPIIELIHTGQDQQSYAAPEYLDGRNGIFRSDIFSLGILAYEMLCGGHPYQDARGKKHSGKYRSIRLLREDIPDWVDAALAKAAASSPQDRYLALSELCHDLRTPNQALVDKWQNSPLLERHPVLVWQVFSLILFALLIWVAV